MSKNRKIFILMPLIIVLLCAGLFIALRPKAAPLPQLEKLLESCEALAAENIVHTRPSIAKAGAEVFDTEVVGEVKQSFRRATAQLRITYLDAAALTENLGPEIQNLLEEYVYEARTPQEVYNEDLSFCSDVLEHAYDEAIASRLEHAEDYCRKAQIPIQLKYTNGAWLIENNEDILDYSLGLREAEAFENSVSKLEYIEFHYRLPDRTSPGPEPNPAFYGETDDPAVILELLESETAKKLIKGQSLDFSADKDFIPGKPIRYYMDDTILSVVWQEVEHGAVGTFAEVFISDASQLRRKLAGDSFGCKEFYYPTVLAEQANAVLAVSGDFYDLSDRVYGLYVYDGQLLRSRLDAGQSCLFTDKGDMLFTYEGQFATEQEAQAYIDENNVMFSLSFGPVMVEKGVDMTPYSYPLGEVLDTYARCAIGQLGELHYLAMTINVAPDYFVYVTLRQAADSMIEHGCYNAYTLDGGQTGSIILGGSLINPVQFGVEREQSDIFYFATAIP